MARDFYIENGRLNDGSIEAYLVEGKSGTSISENIEHLYKMMEVDRMSLEDVVENTVFSRHAVESAQEFYNSNVEYRRQLASKFGNDNDLDARMLEPSNQSLEEQLVDFASSSQNVADPGEVGFKGSAVTLPIEFEGSEARIYAVAGDRAHLSYLMDGESVSVRANEQDVNDAFWMFYRDIVERTSEN